MDLVTSTKDVMFPPPVCLVVSKITQKQLNELPEKPDGCILYGLEKSPLRVGADQGFCFSLSLTLLDWTFSLRLIHQSSGTRMRLI